MEHLAQSLKLHHFEQNIHVDDGLTGADTVLNTVSLQQQLHEAFEKGGFTLYKWISSDPLLEHIPTELCDVRTTHCISAVGNSTKALGLEWDVTSDCFLPLQNGHPWILSQSEL